MRPTDAELHAVAERVCRYRCGECGYEATARWFVHEAHYLGHRLQ